MNFSVSANDLDNLIEKTCELLQISPQITAEAIYVELPTPAGNGWLHHTKLRPGLELTVSDVVFWEQTIHAVEYPETFSLIGMDFCLVGHSRSFWHKAGYESIVAPNQSCWGFTSGFSGSNELPAGERVIVVEISIAPAVFTALIGNEWERLPQNLRQFLEARENCWHLQSDQMTPWMRIAVEQILYCPYQGLTRRLYLEAKVLELIAGYLEQILTQEPLPKAWISLRPDDVERLHQAREILQLRLTNPPSLVELSQQVNLNLKKLKLGFRQVFGTTPFGYVYQQRMEQSRLLLETQNFNVTEVARIVGYASLSAFNTAFKRSFGVNPSRFYCK